MKESQMLNFKIGSFSHIKLNAFVLRVFGNKMVIVNRQDLL